MRTGGVEFASIMRCLSENGMLNIDVEGLTEFVAALNREFIESDEFLGHFLFDFFFCVVF